jgi:hypothetical protein
LGLLDDHCAEGYGATALGMCLEDALAGGKVPVTALEGSDVGEGRGRSSMYLEKLAREVAGLAKMGLKVLRNSV